MGIKAKSKYITRIDAILGDRLRPEDWNAQGSKTSDIANEVITEFSDRYPEYIQVLNRHNNIKTLDENQDGVKLHSKRKRQINKKQKIIGVMSN